MQDKISLAAENLIITEEVSSAAYYTAHYERPVWPGGGSGVTIGVGYDVGAGVKNEAQLCSDWLGKIADDMIAALVPAIGVTGESAHRLLAGIRPRVLVPWGAAVAVFEQVDIPRWFEICKRALPNFEELAPDCRGALLSLTYNRGGSYSNTGARYAEMREIRAAMVARRFDAIPGLLRAMKRLWPGVAGLQHRREHEALLFEAGLYARPVTLPANPAVLVVAPSDRSVGRLQRALNVLAAAPQIPTTGVNDEATKDAVRVLQDRVGLTDDGIAGPKTWAVIESELKRQGKTVP